MRAGQSGERGVAHAVAVQTRIVNRPGAAQDRTVLLLPVVATRSRARKREAAAAAGERATSTP
jgi:hypothetical protein